MQREAMGFGDVTLMEMIGTLVGWQSSLVIFFLAPFAGLVIGLAQIVLRRGNEIPFGPFLCLAAAVLIVRWQAFWLWLEMVLDTLGALVPLFVLFCLPVMGLILLVWRAIGALFRTVLSTRGQ